MASKDNGLAVFCDFATCERRWFRDRWHREPEPENKADRQKNSNAIDWAHVRSLNRKRPFGYAALVAACRKCLGSIMSQASPSFSRVLIS